MIQKQLHIVLMVLVAATGCSTWSNKTSNSNSKMWPPSEWFKKSYQNPHSMAVIWSPDVMAMPGKPPTRGFGGRIYFYNELSQAIPVDGEIIVHGYKSDSGRSTSDKVAADKTFAFSQEQLKNHFSPSELGASYSVWIPWDAAGGLRQEITLIPTFKSVEGKVVQGEPAKLYLPGRKVESDRLPPPAVQAVSYHSSATATVPETRQPISRGLRTTTIEIPEQSALSRSKPMPKQLKTYLLNTAKQKLAEAENSGPPNSNPSDLSNRPPALEMKQTGSESTGGGASRNEATKESETPLLNPLQLKPMRSPISHEPWHMQNSHRATVPTSTGS